MNLKQMKELSIDGIELKELRVDGSVAWKKSRLPSEYQEVEYVRAEPNVGAYINLRFAFDTRAEIYITQIVPNKDIVSYPFGAAENSGILRCMLSSPYGNKPTLYGSSGVAYGSQFVEYAADTDINEFHIVMKKGDRTFTNLTTGESKKVTGQTEYTMTNNLYLFAQNYNGTPRYGSVRIISRFKYYDKNNDLICDLTPCYRKSDNVIGMYDAARDILLTNDGTGTFVKGPDVN